MKSARLVCIVALMPLVDLTSPIGLSAQEHLRNNLVILGTLGGPQSYGDPGHDEEGK
jgi:hypothetical protein